MHVVYYTLMSWKSLGIAQCLIYYNFVWKMFGSWYITIKCHTSDVSGRPTCWESYSGFIWETILKVLLIVGLYWRQCEVHWRQSGLEPMTTNYVFLWKNNVLWGSVMFCELVQWFSLYAWCSVTFFSIKCYDAMDPSYCNSLQ